MKGWRNLFISIKERNHTETKTKTLSIKLKVRTFRQFRRNEIGDNGAFIKLNRRNAEMDRLPCIVQDNDQSHETKWDILWEEGEGKPLAFDFRAKKRTQFVFGGLSEEYPVTFINKQPTKQRIISMIPITRWSFFIVLPMTFAVTRFTYQTAIVTQRPTMISCLQINTDYYVTWVRCHETTNVPVPTLRRRRRIANIESGIHTDTKRSGQKMFPVPTVQRGSSASIIWC